MDRLFSNLGVPCRSTPVVRVRQSVRDGRAEPEGAESLMRSVLGDPSLSLLIRLPGSPAGEYVDLAGDPASALGPVPLRLDREAGCAPDTFDRGKCRQALVASRVIRTST